MSGITLFAIALFVSATQSRPQDLSESEISEIFKRQIIGLQKIRSLESSQVILRGLVIFRAEESHTPVTEEIEFLAVEKDVQLNISITFDVNSSVLRDDQKLLLGPVCASMLSMESTLFQVIGHTDASGPEPYNDLLSVWRAEAVQSYLVNECGVPSWKLQAIGAGERYLLEPERPNSFENRRVEFRAVVDISN